MTTPPTTPQPVPLPPVDPQQVPSLEVVEQALDRADESYRDRAASIDTKAGVILSAAGVIVALVGTHASIAGLIGQVLSIAAGVAGVWTLYPRVDKALNPRNLSGRYLQANQVSTRLKVMNTRILIYEANERRMFDKSFRLKVSSALLLAAAVSIVVGGIVDQIRS